jgi:hypothetical protein|tara:strand:- start:401 stop:715 length:315 start_codon:yes stop_codon:yes gene_type:complete
MKKFLTILSIFFLIIVTTITKNSTKKIENEIFNVKENILPLRYKYELILLEYNYLTSPQKLMEYQSIYFEDDLTPISIIELKMIEEKNNKLVISNFKDSKKINE